MPEKVFSGIFFSFTVLKSKYLATQLRNYCVFVLRWGY